MAGLCTRRGRYWLRVAGLLRLHDSDCNAGKCQHGRFAFLPCWPVYAWTELPAVPARWSLLRVPVGLPPGRQMVNGRVAYREGGAGALEPHTGGGLRFDHHGAILAAFLDFIGGGTPAGFCVRGVWSRCQRPFIVQCGGQARAPPVARSRHPCKRRLREFGNRRDRLTAGNLAATAGALARGSEPQASRDR